MIITLIISMWLFAGLLTSIISTIYYEKRPTTIKFLLVTLLGFISASKFIEDFRERRK